MNRNLISPSLHAKQSYLTVLLAVLASVAAVASPLASLGARPAAAASATSSPVAASLGSWSAASGSGAIKLTSVPLSAAVSGQTSAVDLSRSGANARWAQALMKINNATSFFQVGATYRMTVTVRDLNASGKSMGMLLANGNWQHQPTPASAYGGYGDYGWHTLERTFVDTSPAAQDTNLYLSLPPAGPLHWQVAGAAVVRITAPAPQPIKYSSAAATLSTWSAASGRATMHVDPVVLGSPVDGQSTAMDISRSGSGYAWAQALVGVKDAPSFFELGATYHLTATVRDLGASCRSIGLLLANGNWRHQPSPASVYAGYTDSGWHTIQRTFVATASAAADTKIYFSLPVDGDLHWQITNLSLTRDAGSSSSSPTTAPSKVISFGGAAGSAPSPSVWSYETGGGGWGHSELQSYTNSRDNSFVDGAGHLVINAKKQALTGSDGIQRAYTSARLTTQGKVVIAPGSYVEAPLVAPSGAGVFPAFWMLGANISSAPWPACGEIDVMEAAGGASNVINQAVHMSSATDESRDAPYGWNQGGSSVTLLSARDSGSHLYGVYFDANTVQFYVDRKVQMTLFASDALASGRTWPFGQNQFLVLNVAVTATAKPAISASVPKTMSVGAISIWNTGRPF